MMSFSHSLYRSIYLAIKDANNDQFERTDAVSLIHAAFVFTNLSVHGPKHNL